MQETSQASTIEAVVDQVARRHLASVIASAQGRCGDAINDIRKSVPTLYQIPRERIADLFRNFRGERFDVPDAYGEVLGHIRDAIRLRMVESAVPEMKAAEVPGMVVSVN